MIGTICTVKSFLVNEECVVKLKINGKREELIRFAKGRKIEIPNYQREIRWDLQNTNQLLTDLLKESKFLGNIYLSEEDNLAFEVIDGQQRLTVLYIIITILMNEYSENTNEFKNISLVNLFNASFEFFADINRFESTEDPYKQKTRFEEIHKCIRDFLKKQNNESLEQFCKNIVNSKINIILLENEEKKDAIESFIDINVKGVKLDNEDILKGYIFKKLGNNNDIKTKWVDLKTKYFKLLEKDGSIKITDIFYNVIFCILKNEPELYNIKNAHIDKDFLLSDKIVVEDNINKKEYEKGTHIMELIHMASVVEKIIRNTVDLIQMNLEFFNNNITAHSESFFNTFRLQKVDSEVKEIYFNMVNLLFRNNVLIYKFLITYCYISCINDYLDKKSTSEDIIYYSYFFSFIFDFLSTRKGINAVTNEIEEVNKFTLNLLSLAKPLLNNATEPKLSFLQKLYMPEMALAKTTINGKYTVLQFAILFECFHLNSDQTKIIFKKDRYSHIFNLSNEHFIINDSGKYCENGEEKSYTKGQNSKRNMFINLIPIERELNQSLGNKSINDKIKVIRDREKNDVEFWINYGSEYSREYLEIVENKFKEYNSSLQMLLDNSNLILEAVFKKFKERIFNNK